MMSKVANQTAVCPNCRDAVYQYRSVHVQGTSEYYFRCICGFNFSVYHFDTKDPSNILCQTQARCRSCKKTHKVPIIGNLTSKDVIKLDGMMRATIPCYSCWLEYETAMREYEYECTEAHPGWFFDF